mgnify:CR=1 FL=1
MKKSIILLFLTLTTLLMSGCSVPFSSKDDKLTNVVLVQTLDTSDMTKEEIDLMKESMSEGTNETAGVSIKMEEKNGSIINTITYEIAKMTDEELEESNMSRNMTKEDYKNIMKESGMVCD